MKFSDFPVLMYLRYSSSALISWGERLPSSIMSHSIASSMLDVAYEIIDECYDLEKMLGRLSSYFDYAAFARDLSYDGYIETEYGVLEIR